MQRHRPREHQSLDVAPHTLEVGGALTMVDANDVLVDDRAIVELLGDVVGRRPDQLDAALARPPVGSAPANAGKNEWWMLIAGMPTRSRKSPLSICM